MFGVFEFVYEGISFCLKRRVLERIKWFIDYFMVKWVE